MLTAIVSDLHLGTTSGADLARRPEPLERLAEAVGRADRLVVLGDLLELREQPAHAVLEAAAPVLRALGEATAGRQLVLVPGNHDHQLVAPALERARLARTPLTVAETFTPASGDLAARVAEYMPRTEVQLAYPGIWLRDDVYATHGHYLDVHLSVPRIECIAAAVVGRLTGGREFAGPDDYEAALAPIYAFSHAVAQSASARTLTNGNSLSRRVWRTANRDEGRRRERLLGSAITKAGIPLAVAGLNALGLGPFRADISGVELRRAGLRAVGEAVDRLGIAADHVVFGHTHRAGPLPGDDASEWRLCGGGRLTNTGSWIQESVFIHGDGPSNPYWPGRVTLIGDDGPPRLEGALDDLRLGGPLPPAVP